MLFEKFWMIFPRNYEITGFVTLQVCVTVVSASVQD